MDPRAGNSPRPAARTSPINWSSAHDSVETRTAARRCARRHSRITFSLAPGEHEVLVRAWDSSAATQPEDEAAVWNPKGYVNNARPRIRIRAVVA